MSTRTELMDRSQKVNELVDGLLDVLNIRCPKCNTHNCSKVGIHDRDLSGADWSIYCNENDCDEKAEGFVENLDKLKKWFR